MLYFILGTYQYRYTDTFSYLLYIDFYKIKYKYKIKII